MHISAKPISDSIIASKKTFVNSKGKFVLYSFLYDFKILIYRNVVNQNGASSSTAKGGPPSPALGKANAKRRLKHFCSREKDFMATVEDSPQLNQSLPQGRGRCRVATDEDAPF